MLAVDDTATLSLKVPVEVKRAAQALCSTLFKETNSRGEGYTSSVVYFKTSDVANMLLIRGLRSVVSPIESYTDQVKATCDRFGLLVAFFEASPSAHSVYPSDFPEDGDLREWLSKMIEEEGDCPDRGAERHWVENKYEDHQVHLESLRRATQAIRCALE